MSDSIAPNLANVGLSGIPLTGQDGQPTALARILEGKQGMTVYKPLNQEAISGGPGRRVAPPGPQGDASRLFKKNAQCRQTVSNKADDPVHHCRRQSVTLKPIKAMGRSM